MELLTNSQYFCTFILVTVLSSALGQSGREQLATNYNVAWTANRSQNLMTFDIESNHTAGYVGFGINTAGSMAGAFLTFTGSRTNNTNAYFSVSYAASNSPPTPVAPPTNHTWNMTNFFQNGTITRFRLSRPINSTHSNHNNLLQDGSAWIIWSLGANDNFDYHTVRGHRKVQFLINNEPTTTSTTRNPLSSTTSTTRNPLSSTTSTTRNPLSSTTSTTRNPLSSTTSRTTTSTKKPNSSDRLSTSLSLWLLAFTALTIPTFFITNRFT